jgi:DNA polymerase III epsilon subunit family exonuclease
MSKLSDLTFVAFDTETTGLNPVVGRLVELSGVKFKIDGTIISTFSTLIDPQMTIPPEVTAIHGITNEMVKGMPLVDSVIAEFVQWLDGQETILVAHNAPFDCGFLSVAFAKLGMAQPTNPILDTLGLSRRLVDDAPNHQLKSLTEHLGLESGGYHRALADSYHVKDLLIKLVSLIENATTFADLCEYCDVLGFENGQDEISEADLPERLKPIHQAIEERKSINITYKSIQITSRVVTPQSVHSWRGNFYLNGFCHRSKEDRTFRVDKIVELKILS